jgi:hypothetical protein
MSISLGHSWLSFLWTRPIAFITTHFLLKLCAQARFFEHIGKRKLIRVSTHPRDFNRSGTVFTTLHFHSNLRNRPNKLECLLRKDFPA